MDNDLLDLLAEYLVLAASPTLGPSEPVDYQRLNTLALRLAMELPADVWRATVRGISSGNWVGVWSVVFVVREYLSDGAEQLTVGGPLGLEDVILHKPNVVGAPLPLHPQAKH